MPCRPVRSSGPGSRKTSCGVIAELGDEQVQDPLVDRLLDLEPHRRAEPAAQQLLLQRLQEVLGVVLLDLEVLVAGDPEGVRLEHLHAREQPLEVLADDVLERHEPLVAQRHEAVEDRRHLDPREVLGAGLGVAHEHGEVEREPGDVGERVGRVDGQRRQHREDPVLEQPLGHLLLVAVEVGPADQPDVLGGEGRDDRRRGRAPTVRSISSRVRDQMPVEDLARQQAGGRADGDAGGDAALEAGHPDHEELVEVAREDGQEAHPLQQRQAPRPRPARGRAG